MTTTAKQILSNWKSISDNERKYILIWLIIGLLIFFIEIGARLDIVHKGWIILPIVSGLLFSLFIFNTARAAKNGNQNYLFKVVPISELAYNRVIGFSLFPIIHILGMVNIYVSLFGWAPIWLLSVLTIIWLFVFFISTLKAMNDPERILISFGKQETQVEMSNEKLLYILVIGFLLIMVGIAVAGYYNTQN